MDNSSKKRLIFSRPGSLTASRVTSNLKMLNSEEAGNRKFVFQNINYENAQLNINFGNDYASIGLVMSEDNNDVVGIKLVILDGEEIKNNTLLSIVGT